MDYSIIGIDFGTSATVVNVKNYYDGMQENECHTLSFNGHHLLPTVIFERNDGRVFYGYEAIAEQEAGSEGVFHQNFKMNLISPDAKIREKAKSLIEKFFSYLYSEFERQKALLHVSPTTKTYVSYPAKWTPDMVRFMEGCAIKAGFGNENTVFGETEPTAAIYATFENRQEELKANRIVVQEQPLNVMMLDMGAGTSDITIFKFKVDNNNKFFIGYDNQIITYPSVDNTYLCGGREIDKLLTEYLMNFVHRAIRPEKNNSIQQIELSIEGGVKEWKETNVSPKLRDNESAVMPHSLLFYKRNLFFKDIPFDPFTRSTFELITIGHREQLYNLIIEAIEKARYKINGLNGPEDIDLVILTGGHSLWYLIEDYFKGEIITKNLPIINFKKIIDNPLRLIHEERPQETVANGLVYRDLNFDVAHTSSNNIWCQIKIEGQKSPLFHLISDQEALPVSKNSETFTIELKKNAGTTDSVCVECDIFVGKELNSALTNHYKNKFRIQGDWEALIGDIFGGLFGAEEVYDISSKININIKEDGTGEIRLKNQSNWNDDRRNDIVIKL